MVWFRNECREEGTGPSEGSGLPRGTRDDAGAAGRRRSRPSSSGNRDLNLKTGMRLDGYWPVDTPGGRFYAEFDPETPISREGLLVFFAQFLHAGQRWERFLKNCPLTYTVNRGSKVVNVPGTYPSAQTHLST